MKNLLTGLLLVLLVASCGQEKQPIMGKTAFQKSLNAEYKDATTSPLTEEDLKDFQGLDFFDVDSTFVVTAKFIRTPDEKPFKMKTTTDRLPVYTKYGELIFNLKGQKDTLSVYQNQELMTEENYKDYLFLPFLDETNGLESYGGGRYIDLRIPNGDSLVIDFNTAYNPYCAYNHKYSCPIVPRENYLKTRIEAGVKDFKKHDK